MYIRFYVLVLLNFSSFSFSYSQKERKPFFSDFLTYNILVVSSCILDLLNSISYRHSSYVNEEHLPKYECNERLEFLGDAVLELVSSEFLFFEHPTTPEGELTKTRASMVCEPALAFCAREIELGEYLLLGKGEDEQEEGRENLLLLMLWRH